MNFFLILSLFSAQAFSFSPNSNGNNRVGGLDFCNIEHIARMGSPSQDELDQAKEKLANFLGDIRGEAAVDKVMDKADKNNNGDVKKSELEKFLDHIGLGNCFTRGAWAGGILDEWDVDDDGDDGHRRLDENEVRNLLQDLGLY